MPCHAMQCILCRIIFEKVFICRVHRYATYMYFNVGKKIILVKSGCYRVNVASPRGAAADRWWSSQDGVAMGAVQTGGSRQV
jgi:hypothetical protein